MAQSRALLSNMVAVAGGKAAAAVAGLLTIMVLTRHLGPHDFGYYRTVLTYSAFAAVLADLGIYFVGLREMSRPGADVSRVIGTAFLLRLASTALVLLVTSLIALLLPYDPEVKRGIFLGALIYVGFQANEFLTGVFQRVMKQGGNALAEAAGACATLLAVWLLAQFDAGFMVMLLGTLFGAAVALGISWTLARRLIPFRLRFDLPLWRNYMTAAMPIAGSQILTMAMLRGDTLLLSLMKPAAHVGLYGVPTKMFELVTTLPYMFSGLMMPSLTAAGAPGSPTAGQFSKILGSSLDAMLMYGIGIVLALSICAPQILTLISGPQFAAGAPALVILSFAATLTALSFVVRFALIALDRSRLVLIADAAACAVALLAYFILIPRFSFIGAAIGTTIAEGAILVGMLWGVRRAGHPLPRFKNGLKTVVAGALAAGAIYGLEHAGLHWLLALAIGGALYVGLLALFGAIPRELIASLRQKSGPTGVARLNARAARRRTRGPRVAIINQPQDGIVASDEQRGSVAIVNWELAKRLAKCFDVVVYAPLLRGQRRRERWGSLEIRRIPHVATKVHKAVQLIAGQLRTRTPYFDSMLYYREYFSGVARDLRTRPADIVHLPQVLQFAPLLRTGAPGAKIVLHMHQDELALLDEHPLRERLESIDSVVTVSDWVTRRAVSRFPALAGRIHTIGNGVDIDRFCPGENAPAATGPVRLLFVGRISPDKGVHVLLQAFARLASEQPDVTLDIVGKPGMLPFDVLGLLLRDDPQLAGLGEFYGRSRLDAVRAVLRGQRRSYFDTLMAQLPPHAAARVTFHGIVPFAELLALYRRSHLLVLPSIWNESYGMPVAEAMACGVPVLASDCGGVPELLEPGISGALVARGDLEALLGALRELVADRAQLAAMGRAARRRAELLTWDRSAEKLSRVYDALVDAQASPLVARRAEDATSAYG
ncbi:MAG TPA: glycosyltransferase [Steroidobacteraceae bacterium]|jgi:O-antigen/teichoic acid export membrane protein/glycosyltransferase involved in cell wall biosynthesis|nr:glycosyltransferase [Steroidobacteraceae bacterium]